MKTYLSVIMIVLLAGCVTTNQPTIQSNPIQQTPSDRLQSQEIAIILKAAVKDLQTQGYEPLFLNSAQGFIWARDRDGKMVLYDLQPLSDKMREIKNENTPDD